MNKQILTFLFLLLTTLAAAQTSGGQIKRNDSKQKKEVKQLIRSKNNAKVKNSINNQSVNSDQTDNQFITLDELSRYNVVALSTRKLESARYTCDLFINRGYNSHIYHDPNMGNYLVIAGASNNEQEALHLKAEVKKLYYNSAWILYIVNGIQEIYNK